jgi:hypothetical protein
MLLLPLWAFDRLMMTQHHQDDKAEGHKVVSVTTSGRSGSTLLVQMLAKLPHTRLEIILSLTIIMANISKHSTFIIITV